MKDKIILIDGHSILNRAFYGMPDLTNSKCEHTNAVLGFLNIMFKILEEEKADYLTVAFDVSAPTFRHKMFEAYKGTRKGMPDELREQVPVMKELLRAMNIQVVECPGFEADDILGTIAKRAEQNGYAVSLVSGDRDLLQLASENIKIRIPKTKRTGTEIEDYYAKDVQEKYNCTPLQFIDLKGLMGDSSDNIPGVPGVGEKTASKLIESYGSIENLYEHKSELKPGKVTSAIIDNEELARLSKTLATIKTDCDINFLFDLAKISQMYNDNSYEWFKRLEFKAYLSKFSETPKTVKNIEENLIVIDTLDKLAEEEKTVKSCKENTVIGMKVYEEDGHLLALSFARETNDGIRTVCIEAGQSLPEEKIIDLIKMIFNQKLFVVTTNLKEQLSYYPENTNNQTFDLSVAVYLINPIASSYEADDIARDYLDKVIASREDLLGKDKLQKALETKKEAFETLAVSQTKTALLAYPVILEELANTNMKELYEVVEHPLIYTLYDMEQRGIRANKEALKAYGDELSEQIVVLEKDIYDMVGETFNINSPKQLGVILFEKLHLPFGKKTKTGYSTSADILDKLRCEHEVVGKILEYRQLTKLKSTYADGLAVYISEDGRIHGKFQQTITATGRISSTEPNLQNIPIRMELGRQIRKVFIPEDGYVFLDADYSQIELRVLAHMSDDEKLINAYREAQDIHRMTASEVFHTPFDEVTDLQRSNAKAVNFGIVYGISSFSLGQDLNITRKEAEQYIAKYFDTYPRVKQFLDDLVTNAKKDGYAITMFHRRRPIPELSASNFMQRSFGERVAMNSPIQGTAADIIKIAMIAVNEELKKQNLKSRLLLQIHDELLVETHMDEIDIVKEIMETKMREAANLKVPLEVDCKQGNNWYEAK